MFGGCEGRLQRFDRKRRRLAIAYLLKGKAANTINNLRQKYDVKTATAIAGHLTIAGPCNTETPLSQVQDVVARFAATLQPIPLTIRGVETFLPISATCYLGINPKEPLKALHDALVSQLNWTECYPYHPHVTITEYLTPARTEEAADQLQGLNIHETDTLDSLTLLEKDFRGTWCEIDRVLI